MMFKRLRRTAKQWIFYQELPPGIGFPFSYALSESCEKRMRFSAGTAHIKGNFCHVG